MSIITAVNSRVLPTEKRQGRQTKQRSGRVVICIGRGLAFFLATYCAISLIAYLTGSSYNRNIWWIDMSILPVSLALLAQLALAVVLFAFVVRVLRNLVLRLTGALLCFLFALIALRNAILVYAVAATGKVHLGFFAPFSLFIFVAFMFLGVLIFWAGSVKKMPTNSLDRHCRLDPQSLPASRQPSSSSDPTEQGQQPAPRRLATALIIACTVVALGVLFPLGQILCFGTTTYYAQVEATVVLGAQVLPSGRPSDVLRDRLDTAIALYHEGRTEYLIMSGGIDVDGTNEAEAMRLYALDRGVADKDILVDAQGANTQATARDTVALMREHDITSIAAVSDFFHLARIKMLFLDAGSDVVTIPSVAQAPAFIGAVLREIPGWWYYWFVTIF